MSDAQGLEEGVAFLSRARSKLRHPPLPFPCPRDFREPDHAVAIILSQELCSAARVTDGGCQRAALMGRELAVEVVFGGGDGLEELLDGIMLPVRIECDAARDASEHRNSGAVKPSRHRDKAVDDHDSGLCCWFVLRQAETVDQAAEFVDVGEGHLEIVHLN